MVISFPGAPTTSCARNGLFKSTGLMVQPITTADAPEQHEFWIQALTTKGVTATGYFAVPVGARRMVVCQYLHSMTLRTDALLELEKAAGRLKTGDKWGAAMSIGSALQAKLGQLYASQFFPGGVEDRSHQVPGPAPANDALAEAGVYSRATHQEIKTWFKLWVDSCQKPEVQATADEVAGVVAAIRLFFATVKEPVPLPPATYSLRLIADILADAELTDSEKLDKIRTAVNTGRSGQETPIERRVLRDLSSLL